MNFGFNEDKTIIEITSKEEADALLQAKAQINSPSLTGTPKAPTASTQTKNEQMATSAFATAVLNALYPVGTIIFLASSSPKPSLGTWSRYKSSEDFIYTNSDGTVYTSSNAWKRTA